MNDPYQPLPEHRFTFGLWTVGNPGRDAFGAAVRPTLSPPQIVAGMDTFLSILALSSPSNRCITILLMGVSSRS